MQFDQDPDFSKLKEGENWHLHAPYAPGGTWDSTTATWKFQAKKMVTKLYGPNEKLAIGKDIDIPFILGYNRELNNAPSGWNEGYTSCGGTRYKESHRLVLRDEALDEKGW